eukprot:5662624-Alexandrium_andersonii.AAC.1
MAAHRGDRSRRGLGARHHQRLRQDGPVAQRGSRPCHEWHCRVASRHRAWLARVRCADCGARDVR